MRPPAIVDSFVRWQASTVPARVLATVDSTLPRAISATTTRHGLAAPEPGRGRDDGADDDERDQAAAQPR